MMEPMVMCHKCRKEVLYTLKTRQRTREAYGEKFKYEEEYAECDICGCEICVPSLYEKNEEKFRVLVEKSLLGGGRHMLEIDCNICKNLGDDECNLYGKDCDIAVERCALDGFANYKKDERRKHGSKKYRQVLGATGRKWG